MQHKPPLVHRPSVIDAQPSDPQEEPTGRQLGATIWISRITSLIGLVCLVIALLEWGLRPGHYRLVLALLTVAMFAAILHSYTFESGG